MNKTKIKEETKIKAEKEARCPFDKDLACENCRLYQFISSDTGKICSINYLALRSV